MRFKGVLFNRSAKTSRFLWVCAGELGVQFFLYGVSARLDAQPEVLFGLRWSTFATDPPRDSLFAQAKAILLQRC